METISTALGRSLNYIMTIGIADVVDIVIVAYLIFKAIWFVRKTNSFNLAKGLGIILIVLWASYIFNLKMINYLLRKAVELGLIAIVILFQPELRRLLERVGSNFASGRHDESTELDAAIAQTVLACSDMADTKTGALIIFERKVNLNDIMSTGTIINSDTTAELMKNLFFNKAPLHDGAVILRDGRIAAAGCVLPLTHKNLSKELGMRHRAGIGISEQSDAVVIIVSEETGFISVAIEGTLKRHLTPATLDKILRTELIHEEDNSSQRGLIAGLKKIFKVKTNEEKKSDEKDI